MSYWGASELAISGDLSQNEESATPFELVKAWHGLITSIGDETFVVRIEPIDERGLEEEAEFLIDDVPSEDLPLVQVGAPLYWFVGYESSHGRKRRTSELKMRRLNSKRNPPEWWLDNAFAMIVGPSDSEPTEG